MAHAHRLSDTRVWVRPERQTRPRPGVMFVHGNSQDEMVPLTPEFFGQRRLIHYLANHGYVVMCDQHHGAYAWSKDDSIYAMDAAWKALQKLPGVIPGPVHLVGVSMGNQQSLVWAQHAGHDRVASVTGIIPVCDVAWTYATTFLHDTIDLAYVDQLGGYNPVVNGPEKDPMMFAEALVPIADRITLYPSTGDTIAPPWAAHAFGAIVGCDIVEVDGGEHSEDAVEAVPRADVIAWLRSRERAMVVAA